MYYQDNQTLNNLDVNFNNIKKENNIRELKSINKLVDDLDKAGVKPKYYKSTEERLIEPGNQPLFESQQGINFQPDKELLKLEEGHTAKSQIITNPILYGKNIENLHMKAEEYRNKENILLDQIIYLSHKLCKDFYYIDNLLVDFFSKRERDIDIKQFKYKIYKLDKELDYLNYLLTSYDPKNYIPQISQQEHFNFIIKDFENLKDRIYEYINNPLNIKLSFSDNKRFVFIILKDLMIPKIQNIIYKFFSLNKFFSKNRSNL